MKPEEFDKLLRQKFDDGSFEYNPENWGYLMNRLNEKPKKNVVMLWWTPVIGIAASFSLSMGIAGFMKHMRNPLPATSAHIVAHNRRENNASRQHGTLPILRLVKHTAMKKKIPTDNSVVLSEHDESGLGIKICNIPTPDTKHFLTASQVGKNKCSKMPEDTAGCKKRMKPLLHPQPLVTFKEPDAEVPSIPKNSILLGGGLSQGNSNSGFSIGASARHMITDKVYIESDIAFTTANNMQATKYLDKSAGIESRLGASSSKTSEDVGNVAPILPTQGVIKTANQNYQMLFAQVTPTLGYKFASRFSAGVGPDFQQALADNRPALSTVDRENMAVAPLFDVGIMAKAEVNITTRLKAAFFYREGINNIITPMNKYTDRNYMQFTVRYAVYNK
jgi:hypothetical protein